MYKPESVLENEMHKNLRDFKIEMDHLILAKKKKKKKKTDLVFI